MTVSNSNITNRRAPSRPVAWLSRLRISRYDRVTGMLISLLILLGLCVIGMFAVWVTHRLTPSTDDIKPKTWKVGLKEKELPPGVADDIEPPPPSETDPIEQDPKDMLAAVEAAEATQAAKLGSRLSGDGDGKGGGGPSDKPPESPYRWELRIPEGNTLETYGRLLDNFGIELGVLLPNDQVLYVANFSKKHPTTRKGPRDQEKRYRFTYVGGALENADRELLAQAGVSFEKGTVYKFLPPKWYKKFYALEKECAGDKKVRSTVFGVKPDGGGYQLYILRQSYY